MKKKRRKKEKIKTSPKKAGLGWWDKLRQKDFFKSFWFHLLLFVLVFGLALLLRLLYLTSDPPQVSWSQDLTTDAPTYVSFARAKILEGNWNPFGQYRFVLWLNSAFTLISFLFFKLAGLGRLQANLVAVLLNIFTVVFIYLAVKRSLSKNAALLSSFFLGINYIFLIYGRTTFSEISTLFFIALGFYFLVLGFEKSFFLILSGASHSCAVLFGKMLGAFVFPVCLGILILLAIGEFSGERKRIRWSPFVVFAIGALAVYLPWYLLIYHPVPGDVKFYLKEMSVGLYGAPVAFQSIKDFIYSLYSLGHSSGVFEGAPYRPASDLLYRMPFVFLLSCLFLIFYFSDIFRGKFLDKIKSVSRVEAYLVLWLIIGFLALMPWNYRPLRYQLLILPPFCVLAGIALNRFLNPASLAKKEKLSWAYWIFFIPICSILIFHLFTFILKFSGGTGSFDSLVAVSVLLAVALIILWYLVFKDRRILQIRAPGFRWIATSIIVFLILFININQYLSWAKNPQYSLIRSSQDLGKILNQDAVLSGPYASTLTQDNDLGFCFHMFGVVSVDTLLFQRYPITHLALESRGGNKERAFKDYPEVMSNARLVTTYLLRGMPVEIYRIKEHTGNPAAEMYQLSDFEKAKVLIEQGKPDSAIAFLNQFNLKHPENLSAHLTLSEILSQRGEHQRAISELEKAIQFDDRNYLLHYYLGYLCFQLSDQKKDPLLYQRGIEAWERSLELNPGNLRLAQELRRIRGN